MWSVFEPVHAVVYFDPGVRAAFEEHGVRGFWRSYFAGRAAPMAGASAHQVAAAFYGFRYEMVARAIPSVWDLIAPDEAWTVRRRAAADVLRDRADEVGVEPREIEAAAVALEEVVHRQHAAGRVLFAAHLDLETPDDPFEAIWQMCTLLREHRGDGHVAALTANGVGPVESLLLAAHAGAVPVEHAVANRGWSDSDVDAATAQMVAAGLVAESGGLTGRGEALRSSIETLTDVAAAPGWHVLTAEIRDEVWDVLHRLALAIAHRNLLTYPNPIGVTPPTRT